MFVTLSLCLISVFGTAKLSEEEVSFKLAAVQAVKQSPVKDCSFVVLRGEQFLVAGNRQLVVTTLEIAAR